MKTEQTYHLGPKLPAWTVWLSPLIIWGGVKKGLGLWQLYFLAAKHLEGKRD